MLTINIDKIKNDIIEQVINDITDYSSSDEEKKTLKIELEEKIKKNYLVTEIPFGDIQVNAEDINRVMNTLYIDLLTSYGVLNQMSENLVKYNINYTTYINYINSRIEEIKDMLESCRHSLTSVYMPAFHIERFRTADRFDRSRALQKDKNGAWFPSYCYCHFDEKEQHLTLPLLRQDNSLRYDNRVATAYISTHFQLGEGFVDLKSNETDIENCIDESESTFWSDTILSDAPLRVSFEDKKPAKMYANDNYFYGIDNGAVCELEINFESVNTVNEISLTPFTKYPINIVAIRYKISDDDDEELKEIVYPENEQPMLRSKFTKDKISFKFQEIICKKIYILFVQEHYLRKTYVYNPIDVYKNELWFNSKNDKRQKVAKAEYKPVYYDRANMSAVWKNINDNIVKSPANDIVDIVVGSDTCNRKVLKYEYNYGFYNIGCFNNHFDRTGFYISKPISPGANIKQVQIKTKEIHQKDSKDNYITDIEYYITGSERPDEKDWYPIMPIGVKTIKSELLMITGGTRAYLRFQTDKVHCVMKNGEPLDPNDVNVNYDRDESTGHIFCIRIANYDYDAVYSVSYDPIAHSDLIDLSNKLTTSIETFEGKNKNSFKLSDEPYIDNTIDYCTVKLIDVSKNTTGIEIEIENVTDLSNQSIGYRNFNSTNRFQYYVYKNSIYFNKEVPKDYIVEVSYRHLISKIRTKAIFRRNSTKDGWLTPILQEIKYNIETY